MSEDRADAVSAVASAVLQSDMETKLSKKLESKSKSPPAVTAAGDGDKKVEKLVKKKESVKKKRLTPSKVLSMIKKSKVPAKAAEGHDKAAAEGAEAPSDVGPPVMGKKKKHKKDVKEAILGARGLKKKIKKRGSSSEDESKEKKPRRRRRREKAKPKSAPPPPPPKEPTPPPPPPPKEPTPPPPKEPTPPPPKDPTPPAAEETTPPPAEEPEASSAAKEESPPKVEERKEDVGEAPEPVKAASIKSIPPPAADDQKGPPSDTDEEIISESSYLENCRMGQRFGSSMCCAVSSHFRDSFISRLVWLMVLIYRGPIRCTAAHMMARMPYDSYILGPTFDSVLIEYLHLILDAADKWIHDMFPDMNVVTLVDINEGKAEKKLTSKDKVKKVKT